MWSFLGPGHFSIHKNHEDSWKLSNHSLVQRKSKETLVVILLFLFAFWKDFFFWNSFGENCWPCQLNSSLPLFSHHLSLLPWTPWGHSLPRPLWCQPFWGLCDPPCRLFMEPLRWPVSMLSAWEMPFWNLQASLQLGDKRWWQTSTGLGYRQQGKELNEPFGLLEAQKSCQCWSHGAPHMEGRPGGEGLDLPPPSC